MNERIKQEQQLVEAADGHRVRLDVHRPRDPNGYGAILCHGIFTNRSEDGSLDRLADELAARGVTAVRFDFRGHGQSAWSSTSFTPLGAIRDLHAVVLWCQMTGLTTHLIGSSFGGSTVLNYLSVRQDFRPRSLVLLNPVVDYHETFVEPKTAWGQGLFTSLRVDQLLSVDRARITPHFIASFALWAQLRTIRPYDGLSNYAGPTLVLHGDLDDKVPVEAARTHFRGKPTVDYREVRGAGHGFSQDFEGMVLTPVLEWLSSASESS